jgi:hypothetical protein
MVGELFPWSPSSTFAYTRSNHNSVLGIGAYASEAGAKLQLLDAEQVQAWLQQQRQQQMRQSPAVTPVAAAVTMTPPPVVADGPRQASGTAGAAASAADAQPPQASITGEAHVATDDIMWDAPNPDALLNLRQRPAVASAGADSHGQSSVWVSRSSSSSHQGFVQASGLSSWEPLSDWEATNSVSLPRWQQARPAGDAAAAASDLQDSPTDSPPTGPGAAGGPVPALPRSPAKQQPQQGPAGPDSGAQRWRLPQDEYRRHRHLFKRIPWDPAMREYQADELRVGMGSGSRDAVALGDVAAEQPWVKFAATSASSSSGGGRLALSSPAVMPAASKGVQSLTPGGAASTFTHIGSMAAGQGSAQVPVASVPTYHLLAYPAQDNFAGVIYPLEWVQQVGVGAGGHRVCAAQVDAACALLITQPAAYGHAFPLLHGFGQLPSARGWQLHFFACLLVCCSMWLLLLPGARHLSWRPGGAHPSAARCSCVCAHTRPGPVCPPR